MPKYPLPGSETPTGTVAFIIATPEEFSCLQPLLRHASSLPAPPGMMLRRGRLGSDDLLVLTCGVGKVPAAAGTMFLLERCRPRAVLLIGTAGSLDPRLRIGDLVVADEVLPADVGVIHSEGFGQTGPGLCVEGRLLFHDRFPLDGSLAEAATRTASQVELIFHRGRIITCDQVVLDPELRAYLGKTFQALAVEMEGSAVAQVAAGASVPLAVIRAISDELGHDFVGLEEILPYCGQSRTDLWTRRFRMMTAGGSVLARVREMRRGTRRALASLNRFLEAFLPVVIRIPTAGLPAPDPGPAFRRKGG